MISIITSRLQLYKILTIRLYYLKKRNYYELEYFLNILNFS